jgi:uncharacterized membrane protein HdeD (DUF308 family)
LSHGGHLVFAWHSHESGGALWELLLGLVYLITGGYLLIHPALGLASFTLALAIYLLAEGVLELILAFWLRPAIGWGWLRFDAIITLILAV